MQTNSASILGQQLGNTTDGNQYISFSIDDEEFGIEIVKVQEIIGYQKPTLIPNMPDFISGVINLRGAIIPVIDIRKRFSMPEKEYDKYTVIVVVEVATKIVGIIVDAVSDVLALEDKDIQEVPDFNKFNTEYLTGMGKVGEKLVLLLNIDKILKYDEFKRLDDIDSVE